VFCLLLSLVLLLWKRLSKTSGCPGEASMVSAAGELAGFCLFRLCRAKP
jgi:hypothetical protein